MEFPGSLVVRLHASMARGLGLIPGWGTNIPQGSVAKKKNIYIYIFFQILVLKIQSWNTSVLWSDIQHLIIESMIAWLPISESLEETCCKWKWTWMIQCCSSDSLVTVITNSQNLAPSHIFTHTGDLNSVYSREKCCQQGYEQQSKRMSNKLPQSLLPQKYRPTCLLN